MENKYFQRELNDYTKEQVREIVKEEIEKLMKRSIRLEQRNGFINIEGFGKGNYGNKKYKSRKVKTC